MSVQRRFDFSGGIQTATTWLLRKTNEVEDAINARFDRRIGAITRRLGYTAHSIAIANKKGLGFHESKFSTGAKFLAAHNNSGDSATVVRSYSGSWSALTLPATIDPNTQTCMIDSLGETYVAGKSTTSGVRMALVNIKNDLTTSASRNLLNAPAAAGIVEYGGALYAINVMIGSTVYSDRAYRSSQAMGAITYVQGVQVPTSSSSFLVKVDTVRYIKTNLSLDIYKAGSETRLQAAVTPSVVDKNLNTMTITPVTTTVSAVNTTTDVLTIGLDLPTGTPIGFINSGGALPTGISAGTNYYWVRLSSTTGNIAASYANATATTPVIVDITGAGSGTTTLLQGFSDNDELWGTGRKNELAYYWNTDYPTVDTADFLRIPPGVASDPEITAWGKSNNRLFLFTKSSAYKWDNANLVTVYEDIGCPNIDTLQNIGNWMIWATADNTVQARNDSTGQDQTISEAMRNNYFEILQTSNLAVGSAAAQKSKKVYKLCVGTVNGQVWRFTYNFKANNWSREIHNRSMLKSINSDASGTMMPYFLDDKGNVYIDELGNTDDGTTIPFSVTLGRDNQGVESNKLYQGFYVFGNNVAGASFKAAIEGGDMDDIDQLTGLITKIKVAQADKLEGRDIDVEITINSDGDAPEIEGVATYFDVREDGFGN